MSSAHRLVTTLALMWSLVTLGWWALAFYPANSPDVEWLAAAQSVCFGTQANGLPDSFGWILLIGMPASLGSAFFIAYQQEIFSAWKNNKTFKTVSIILLLFFIMEGSWVQSRIREGLAISNISFDSLDVGSLPDHYPRTSRPLPDFTLIDHRGLPISNVKLLGRNTIMTFAFGSCATVCPVLIRDTREAASVLGPEKVQLVYITLDPWRDTPSRLADLAKSWQLPSHAYLLGGEGKAVNQTLDRLNMPRKRDDYSGQLDHPALVYVINADGHITYTFNNPSTEWLVDAVRRLKIK